MSDPMSYGQDDGEGVWYHGHVISGPPRKPCYCGGLGDFDEHTPTMCSFLREAPTSG